MEKIKPHMVSVTKEWYTLSRFASDIKDVENYDEYEASGFSEDFVLTKKYQPHENHPYPYAPKTLRFDSKAYQMRNNTANYVSKISTEVAILIDGEVKIFKSAHEAQRQTNMDRKALTKQKSNSRVEHKGIVAQRAYPVYNKGMSDVPGVALKSHPHYRAYKQWLTLLRRLNIEQIEERWLRFSQFAEDFPSIEGVKNKLEKPQEYGLYLKEGFCKFGPNTCSFVKNRSKEAKNKGGT
jgi:hypothetical protein